MINLKCSKKIPFHEGLGSTWNVLNFKLEPCPGIIFQETPRSVQTSLRNKTFTKGIGESGNHDLQCAREFHQKREAGWPEWTSLYTHSTYVSFWIHLIQRISQASSTLGYFLVPIKKKYIKSFCLPVASGESFRYLRNFTSTNKPVSCYCGSWQPSNRSYHGGKKNYENSKTCQQWKIKDITFYFSSLDSLLPQTILPLIEVFTCKPWAPMEFLGAKEKLA